MVNTSTIDNILLGGNGYIGSYLAQELRKTGQSLLQVDRSMNIKNLIKSGKRIFYLLGQNKPNFDSVSELKLLGKVLNGIDEDVCTDFIFFSSALIYGETSVPANETDIINPTDIYSKYKADCEELIYRIINGTQINRKIIRISNVYGRQGSHGFLSQVFNNINITNSQKNIYINGNGKQLRDFIFIDDVVKSIIAICKQGGNDIINASFGSSRSLLEVVEILNRIGGCKYNPVLTHKHKMEIKSSFISNYKLIEKYNYCPKYGLEDGIRISLLEYA